MSVVAASEDLRGRLKTVLEKGLSAESLRAALLSGSDSFPLTDALRPLIGPLAPRVSELACAPTGRTAEPRREM